jgi:hypothetical protein
VEEPPKEPTHPADIALEAAEVIDDPDAGETPVVEESIAPIGVADKVDPALVEDINNELQEQGIGSMQDPFSTKIHIVGHVLRKGKLVFTCKFGGSIGNTKVIKVDVPAAVAKYILLHRVGKGATDSESCKYYEWASRSIPSLR